MRKLARSTSARWWRLPHLGWAYVVAVATLATVSTFTDALTAYLVLLVVTLPTGVAAQLANLTLVFGLAALFRLEPDGYYPLLGALTVVVWTLAGWANAKLFQLGWRQARGWLAARGTQGKTA